MRRSARGLHPIKGRKVGTIVAPIDGRRAEEYFTLYTVISDRIIRGGSPTTSVRPIIDVVVDVVHVYTFSTTCA